MITAKEQAQKSLDNLNAKFFDDNPKWINRDPTEEGLIEFAKQHVVGVLKALSKTEAEYQWNLNYVYPLSKIK